ncbi:amino acid adenylation domain-containing protein [Tenacibaculum sp. MAR_2009_124]|uniref:non-ribosomal peptide synthetase n=1 Tax=Tenacibaculum sp. MAR_2009_124 TaxID=1250059 RepID=UPI00089BB2AA|nr:non-ribosomal peptide synthetase [Tenacibaculum sp. MAR_2009_124]SEB35211.1 amino acid adenylation domain-containing protein [Tenacibaculum sp. MAR_2009_124]
MNTEILSILKEAKQEGVKIGVKGDSLTVKTVSPISSELLQKIKENKPDIIEYIQNLRSKNKTSSLKKITPYDRETITKVPLSFGQERLWFVDSLQGSQAYHMPFVLRFDGELDASLIEQSFRYIINRHEVLRTNILSEDGVGYQKVVRSEDWTLTQETLSEDKLEERLEEYLTAPFDLANDYKLRVCLYDIGNKKYVLACVFHHIASDGWSEDILVNEFTIIHSSLQAGIEVNLPELTLQYADYAVWQRKYLEGSVLNFQLLYWEEKLKNATPLSLPTDYPRPAVQSTAGDHVTFTLDKKLSDDLNDLCEKEGVTIFMLLLAGFKVLLSRYSGQDDICIGTPIANRTQSELEGMIGFFVNTLALRSDLSGNPKFSDLLKRIKDTTLEGYDYQLAPFERIVDRVVTERDMSKSPLFQVMFILQNTAAGDDEEANETEIVSGDLTISEYGFDAINAMFDLSLDISEGSQGISFEMVYCTDLFKGTTIERMMNHYQELLKGIVKDASQYIGELPMLTALEESDLITNFNNTSITYPEDTTVIDLFLQRVEKAPEDVAIVYEETVLTYKELDERSNQLANFLLTNYTINKEDPIGVVLERSDWLLVSFLAILKTGGCYVPIDPAYPTERKEYIEKDSGSIFIVNDALINSFKENSSLQAKEAPAVVINSKDLVYIIYTSGSTGKPKGVMIEHRNIINTLLSQITAFSITSEDHCLQFASQSFDASIWELGISLLGGASLYIIKEDRKSETAFFKEFIKENKITFATLPPAFLQLLKVEDLTGLKTLITAGEAIPLGLAQAFSKSYNYVNAYGPTETSICATTFNGEITEIVPIGKPIDNTQIYILNDLNKLLPIGAVGELCIGGIGVARGYLNREELTNEKFIDNPFRQGERIYKTGDLAKWLPNGDIEFIGRKDSQVKIRGYRIEIGEVENALASLASVNQSCVLAKEDVKGNKRLIGYVVSEEDFNKESIQEGLKEVLPEYMVPTVWIDLDEMPLTTNGKIDRKSLPEPDGLNLSSTEYIGPRNETEVLLVAIWQDLLGVEKIGVNDNFFELGGHSLLIVQLIDRIQKEGYHIEIADVFGNPTIAAIDGKLSSGLSTYQVPPNGIVEGIDRIAPEMVPLLDFSQEEVDSVVDLVPGGIENIQDMYPLSPLQEGMYFHYLMSDKNEGDLYVSPNLLLFKDKGQRIKFIEALQFVVNRHDVLRTCFISENLPNAVQVVLKEAVLSNKELKLNSSDDIRSQLESLVESGNHWMDVSKAPLLDLKHVDDNEKGDYYLLVNNHHLIIDHVGLEKIIEEVNLHLLGHGDILPPPVLYRDFIGHTLHQQETNDSASYFKNALGNINEPTYPFNLSNVRGNGTDIAEASIGLPEELSKEIRIACTNMGITPAILFHAAFGIVVGMCSNRKQALFGSLFSGRLQGAVGAADSLGLFINTLPLLFNIEGTVAEYIQQVKERLAELLPYEQTPLPQVHSWSGISNEVPLFSAIFNYRHSSSDELDEDLIPEGLAEDIAEFNLDIELLGDQERTNYPFSLAIDDFGDDFGITAQMDLSIQPERVLSYMEVVVRELLQGLQNETEVGRLSILAHEEETQLLKDFNETVTAYPEEKTIIDLFVAQVEKNPEAIALTYKEATLSYKQLDELSNQLANHILANYTINNETFIAVTLERSNWLIVSFLAVLKSGGVYIPIDPVYPEERKEYIKTDSSSTIVIDEVFLENFKKGLENYHKSAPNVTTKSNDLAYIIYTSGSTGKPKGVMIEHYSIINTILSQIADFSIDTKDNCLQFASPSFDASIWEIGIALLSGASLCIVNEEGKSDVSLFKKFIQEQTVTFATLPPAFLQLLEVEDLSTIKTLVTAGEAIPLNLAKAFSEKYNYINAYGPTETSICATTFNGTIEELVPIGKPIDNTQVYILNDTNELLPSGVVGELCVGGRGVARGYLNREELTKEKFIKNPFIKGDTIYKTGDLAKWLPDGSLEFIGRKDNQVKIRGYRIELGEVENVLSSLTIVNQCCVLAKSDASGNKQLVAYVVVEGDFDRESLQDGLIKILPEYMVPTIWIEMKEIPVTSNGKLDRKALPEPDGSMLSTQEYLAPRNETEEKLVEIWQELLQIEKIGVYDNFFELGGHSLLVTRLVSLIRKDLEVEVAIRDIFEHTTIASQALHVLTCSRAAILPEVVAQEKEGNIPLSFNQERLWFLDQLQGSSQEYHIPVVEPLQGNIDVEIVEKALRIIVDRHEILRTVIYEEEGVGYQKVISSENWQLQKVIPSKEVDLEEEITNFIGQAFDLSKDYMVRACLYDLGEDGYVLVCVLHHISSDGISGIILMNEFSEIYSTLLSKEQIVLPKLNLQYSDYAIWQRSYFAGEVLEKQLSYWENKLKGVSTLKLPTDYIRPTIQNNEGSSIILGMGKELTHSVKSLCNQEKVTPFMFMLSVFKVLLSRYSNQEDICVGTPIANRTQFELEGMIGFFVNTLALRSDLSGNPSFKEVLSIIKETTLDGYDHQLTPFEKVVDKVVTAREMSMTPLFQVMFDYHNEDVNNEHEDESIENNDSSKYDNLDRTAQFDLTLDVSEEGAEIVLSLNYCTALFKQETAARMLDHYKELLVSIVNDIDKPISETKILTTKEETQLLNVFNATKVAYPLDKTVVDLFGDQVQKSPTAIAATFEGLELSYQELDNRSNQLANYLVSKGVKADDLIGICLERGLDMIIGVLGILKAGAAYVPIKPDFPQDRIAYLLEDTNCSLVVSNLESQEKLEPFSNNIQLVELESIADYATNGVELTYSPNNLAYIIYTSGSTGLPKGAMIEHAGLLNHLLLMVEELKMTNDSVVAFTAPFTFDISVWQLLSALLCGGSVAIYSEESILDIEEFQSSLSERNISHLQLVPSYIASLLETGNSTAGLSNLDYFLVTGEAATKSLLDKWFSLYPQIPVVNAYGPAEAADDITLHIMNESPNGGVVPIGKPVANMDVYVVDRFGNLCPIGVIGELWTAGIGVGRGYLNRTELTKEKFIENPFITEGGRLYKTGDLGRWLPDGTLEFVGRTDDQVKIRGYRIELGEIENAISQVASIQNCCVLAKKDQNDINRLVGYVVVEGEFNKEKVQDVLKDSLPEYMVPMLWITLEEMPLTANGKIDKKSLPEPDTSQLSTREYVAPRNEIEKQLVAIWQELLGVEKIGVNDDFFELGGHSLLATRLVSLIRKNLEREIAIRDVFEYTTIASLAICVSKQSKGVLLPAIVAEERPEYIPLSFSQERLWFLDQLQGTLAYHMPTIIRLNGDVDVSVLEETFKTIVARHEVLRTNILSEEGYGYQQIVSHENWELEQQTILEDELRENVEAYIETPFNLSNDYKLKACLYDLGNKNYVLTAVVHHIANDGWSEEILIHEFNTIYSALESGVEVPLPELTLQYADYSIWQRKYFDGEVLENQLSYWEDKLKGVSTLSMPTDYMRPTVQSTEGAIVEMSLTQELGISIHKLCESEGVTSFMFLLSAFKVLLSRYSGQDDICIGTTIANRTQTELEGMIGFFVNTLVLRSDMSNNPSFKQLLSRVKETTLESYDNQLAPFEKIVDRVVTTRDMSSTPIFQVMFSSENTSNSSEEQEDVETGSGNFVISPYETDTSVAAQFDLSLDVSEENSIFELTLSYSTALFKEETIVRILEQYQELLTNIITNIEQPIGSLPILTKKDETQLLNVFNATNVDYPLDKTVVDLFTNQVQKSPKAIAVSFEGAALSYQELDKRSNQLAHCLVSQGVKSDDLIGICLERGLDMIIGVLGILKAGGAYVPMKPDFPKDRNKYLLEDTGCSLLVSNLESQKVLESFSNDIELIVLENVADYATIPVELTYKSKDLAYVIYTSGSTGMPKGAMIEHAGLLNHLLLMVDELKMTTESVTAFTAPFTFDISVWQMLSALLCGGSVAIYSEESVLDMENFQLSLSEQHVSHLQLVPSYVTNLLESGRSTAGLSNLDYFLVTGEAATKSLLDKWFRLYPQIPVVNAYGPAEAADDITLHIMNESPNGVVVPIGKPVANMDVYVVDRFGNLCPIGVIGELWTAGIGVGRGYLNRADLTEEKFIENPFTAEGGRLYKTGDLGRWLPDGTLEFVGRSDDQVKIRGYRIELGEIENVLSQAPSVQNCCVLAMKDQNEINRLVGYVVVEGEFHKRKIQDTLKDSLPEYMVPMLWIVLDEMPLTANGKIDKKSLPEPDSSELSTQEYVAPRSEIEHQLVAIWQELLDIERIGIYDDFFELGGHSLLATRLVSLIRKELEREVAIRDVFEHTTIDSLGTHVSEQAKGMLLPAILAEKRPQRIPLSFSQERLWFLDELQGTLGYHMPTIIRLEGNVDRELLQRTFKVIIDRHEVLKTNILSENGEGYQEVVSSDNWILTEERISEDSLEKNLEDYLLIPFDLSSDYKLRARLFDLGNNKYVLASVTHHIASDGWSEDILMNELIITYNALENNAKVSLPALSLQYADYAIWQRKYFDGEVLENQLSYWEDKLKGVSTLSLPTDYARPAVQSSAGDYVSLGLGKELSGKLNALCEEEGVTLFMLLLATYKVLLSRYSGQEDICVGTPIANRTQAELEEMIGFFVNTLALRSDLTGNPSFKEFLGQLKETTLEGYDNQLAPFEKVVDRAVTNRDMSTSPLFQTMLVLQNTGSNDTESELDNAEVGLGDLSISDYDFDAIIAMFDLSLNVSENNEGISLEMLYCTDLFERATIERMLIHFEKLLRGIVADIAQPINGISMLTQQEEHKLLHVYSATKVDYIKYNTVLELFSKQVKTNAKSVAVVFEGEKLTYKELDRKSNQVARYLQSHGIQKDGLVGICMERSLEMIIAIFGVLKSGGAYVPIDPAYPKDRIDYMIEDTGTTLLLSNSSSKENIGDRKGITMVCLDTNWEEVSSFSNKKLNTHVTPDSLAYIIYTSGSTGKPKGVMIEHKNMFNLVSWGIRNFEDSLGLGMLASTSINFDLSIFEIFVTLSSGSKIYLVDNLLSLLEETEISVSLINTVPSVLQGLLDSGKIPNTVRTINLAGEPLLPSLVNRIYEESSVRKVHDLYGPSEATTYSTFTKRALNGIQSIGKPIANTQTYVVDADMNLAPLGVVGELCIGGKGVARGYLNREELTEEKFIPNPFKEGDRLYKTGDLARWLSDGTLEYLGRKDNQVKIRGYRIELGEIETALAAFAEVNQSCILAKEDSTGNKRLVGYVVVEGKLNKQEIQQKLKASLPDYMVPSIWVELDEMPLTANGKLDRKALVNPEGDHFSTVEYVAPRNEKEEKLVGIWQDLLGIEKIGVYDDFFELGGHSLMVIKLVAQINELFNTDINIVNVFEYPTIAEFVQNMTSKDKVFDTNLMVALQDKGSQKPIFLAPPGGGLYNCYVDLARALGEDQPVYGFQCPGINGKTPVSESIEEMASSFIVELQKADPYGPYRLGGYSFGGVVAYEMALQLKEKGFEVEELFMFDSTLLDTHTTKVENKDELFEEFVMDEIEEFVGENFDFSKLKLKGKTKDEQLEVVYKLAKKFNIQIPDEEIKGFFEVSFTNEIYPYHIKNEVKLDTNIILFKAMYMESEVEGEEGKIVPNTEYEQYDYNWGNYTNKEVIIHLIPSIHTELLDIEHIEVISESITNIEETIS